MLLGEFTIDGWKNGLFLNHKILKEAEKKFSKGGFIQYGIKDEILSIFTAPKKKVEKKHSAPKGKQKEEEKILQICERRGRPLIHIRDEDVMNEFAKADSILVKVYSNRIVAQAVKNKEKEPSSSLEEIFQDVEENPSLIRAEVNLPFQELLDSLRRQLDKVKKISKKTKEFFCSGGFWARAAKEVGLETVLGVDYNPGVKETFEKNIKAPFLLADMRTLDKSELVKTPIIMGSPSCRAFTKINLKRLQDHPDYGVIQAFQQGVLDDEECKIFVFENVPDILTANNGEIFEEFKEGFGDEWRITADVLTAANYGDPQVRKRAFVYGSTLGRILHPAAKLAKDAWKTIREAFVGLHDGIPNHTDLPKQKPEVLERFKYIGPGENWGAIPEEIRPNVQHSNSYLRQLFDAPAKTVVNLWKLAQPHPDVNLVRTYSIREMLRLQGIPDDFVLYGTSSAKRQMCGDGVPFHTGKAVLQMIVDTVDAFNAQIDQLQTFYDSLMLFARREQSEQLCLDL